MTPSKRDRVFSADEHLCRAAISKPYQESFLLQAANNLFQGSQDSLRGAYNRETAKIPSSWRRINLQWVKNQLS